MKRSLLLLVLFLGVFLSSCAFGTRHVTLTYPPQDSAGVTSKAEAAKLAAPKQGTIVMNFIDRRSDPTVVGEVRNGWGLHTADVVAVNSVPKWVSESISKELEAAGYTVSLTEVSVLPSSSLSLSGEILTVYCTALFFYEGEVSFIARALKDGKELINKRYTGKGSAGVNWAATAGGYGQSLALALSDATQQLVQDLRNRGD